MKRKTMSTSIVLVEVHLLCNCVRVRTRILVDSRGFLRLDRQIGFLFQGFLPVAVQLETKVANSKKN